MERDRPITILALVIIALGCIAGVITSFNVSPEHPFKTSLLTLSVILGGILVITGIHLLMFVPMFTIISKLCAKKTKLKNADLDRESKRSDPAHPGNSGTRGSA